MLFRSEGVNLAVNLVGGTVFAEITRSLAREGRLAIVGYVDGEHHADIDLNAAHVNRLQIFGISNVRLKREERAVTTRGFVRDILPAIAALDADVITIETSRSDMELLEGFGEFRYPNEIGPGVYDIHSPRVPDAGDMLRLLEKAKRLPW